MSQPLNYLGSEAHTNNILAAQKKAQIRCKELQEIRVHNYYSNPTLCNNCNNAIDYKKRANKFCSSSCAAKFNNIGRVRTEESKQKLSEKIMLNKHNSLVKERVCKECNTIFVLPRMVNSNRKFCSIECKSQYLIKLRSDPGYRERLSARQKQLYKDGVIQGWASRDKMKPSYPEQYFINLFNKEQIDYQREVKFGKYFADFYFDDNQLILEVDGKQHEYPANKQGDMRKDEYLTNQGFKVFRIKWVNPTNEKNRELLYNQIVEFKKLLV